MFWIILIALGVAWVTQSWLSFRQSQSFAKLFVALRRLGRVAMGRFRGGFMQGAIVLFVIDDDGVISEGHKLQGVTVAARFKRFSLYDGESLDGIDPALAKNFGRPAIRAVENAQQNYRIVSAGGQAPEPPTALSRVLNRLPLPKFRRAKKPVPLASAADERIKISRTTRSGQVRTPMEGVRVD